MTRCRKVATSFLTIASLCAVACGSGKNTAHSPLTSDAGTTSRSAGVTTTSGGAGNVGSGSVTGALGSAQLQVHDLSRAAAVQTAAVARTRSAFRLGVVYLKGLEAAYA